MKMKSKNIFFSFLLVAAAMVFSAEETKSTPIVYKYYDTYDGEYYEIEYYFSLQETFFSSLPLKSYDGSDKWALIPKMYSSYNDYYHSFDFALNRCTNKAGIETCELELLRPETEIFFYEDAINLKNERVLRAAAADYSYQDTLFIIYQREETPLQNLLVVDFTVIAGEPNIANRYIKPLFYDFEKTTVEAPWQDFATTPESSQSSTEEVVDYYVNEDYIPISAYVGTRRLKLEYSTSFGKEISGYKVLVAVVRNSQREFMQSISDEYDSIESLEKLPSADILFTQMKEMLNNPVNPVASPPSVLYSTFLETDRNGIVDYENAEKAIAALKVAQSNGELLGDLGEVYVLIGTIAEINTVDYKIAFNLKEPYEEISDIFIGNKLLKEKGIPDYVKTGTNRDDEPFFESLDIYKVDECLSGSWNYKPNAVDGFDVDVYVMNYNEIGSKYDQFRVLDSTLIVYPLWEPCDGDPTGVGGEPEKRHISLDINNGGSFYLSQYWPYGGLREPIKHYYESIYTDDGTYNYIFLPSTTETSFTFNVHAYPDAGYYELVGKIKFTYTSKIDDSEKTIEIEDGGVLEITPDMENMEISGQFDFKPIHITFATDGKTVFYGENSSRETKIKFRNDSSKHELPKVVYTSNECVSAWSMYPEEKRNELLQEYINNDPQYEYYESDFGIFNYFSSNEFYWLQYEQSPQSEDGDADSPDSLKTDDFILYPVWSDAATCVNEYGYEQILAETSENGSFGFEETRLFADSAKPSKFFHTFSDDNKMLLPVVKAQDSKFTILGLPNEGYGLEFVEFSERGVAKTVQYLDENEISEIKANGIYTPVFSEIDPTPMMFVQSDLKQSGSAIQLNLLTSEFDVRRKAKLRLTVENDDGEIVIDTLLSERIREVPYETSWEYYPFGFGTYLLTAIIFDAKDTVVIEKDFEVKAEIAAVNDGWQMLSINNVEMDSILWDGDAQFYWWNESLRFGDYWQYQEVKQNDKLKENQGAWYSSLDKRSLMLKPVTSKAKETVWNLDSVYSGWNMVANPYSWCIQLQNSDKSEVSFWRWNAETSSYEEANILQPYEAVWAKVSKKTEWKLPKNPVFVATVDEEGEAVADTAESVNLYKASNLYNWSIQAVLSDKKGKVDSWNIMGVSDENYSSEEPPAGMGNRVNLSIADDNRLLAKSFKKRSTDAYEWEVNLGASSERMGYLSFNGIQELNDFGLRVYVSIDGKTTEMGPKDSLKVKLSSSAKKATVYVAKTAKIEIAYKLDNLHAFKVGPSLDVSFSATNGLEGTAASVELLDMKGNIISSESLRLQLGVNKTTLKAPKSGLYMIRVKAGNQTQANKIIVQ